MIIEYVNNDPGIFVVPGRDPEFASACDGMHVGIGIDIAVDQDPFTDQFREPVVVLSLDIVAHEIPHNDLFIAA